MADLRDNPNRMFLIPGEDWTCIYDYYANFRNCRYCREGFYHTPRNPHFFNPQHFVCVHCDRPDDPASESQGIYLSKKMIDNGYFHSEWYQSCGCCRTMFYVGKKPPRKTITTKKVSKETGIARKVRMKTRSSAHLCDRCDGSRGEAKDPSDFGGTMPFARKVKGF